MRTILPAEVLVGISMLGGCGLVFVPTVQEYPGPVKGVRVVESNTSQPLPGAHVRFDIVKHQNWTALPPRLDCLTERNDIDERELATTLKSEVRDGLFEFERKCLWGTVQIWFPLPPVLGPAVLREHEAIVEASAKGHTGTVFTYNPRNPPVVGSDYRTDGPEANRVRFGQDSVLTFFLTNRR